MKLRFRDYKTPIPEPLKNGQCRSCCPFADVLKGCKYYLCNVKHIDRGAFEDNLPDKEYYPGEECPWGK